MPSVVKSAAIQIFCGILLISFEFTKLCHMTNLISIFFRNASFLMKNENELKIHDEGASSIFSVHVHEKYMMSMMVIVLKSILGWIDLPNNFWIFIVLI